MERSSALLRVSAGRLLSCWNENQKQTRFPPPREPRPQYQWQLLNRKGTRCRRGGEAVKNAFQRWWTSMSHPMPSSLRRESAPAEMESSRSWLLSAEAGLFATRSARLIHGRSPTWRSWSQDDPNVGLEHSSGSTRPRGRLSVEIKVRNWVEADFVAWPKGRPRASLGRGRGSKAVTA